MDLLHYFRRVPTLSADEIRQFLKAKKRDEYNLVDVRQPEEYVEGHLPGADLMPLGELPLQKDKLDPAKPTIVY